MMSESALSAYFWGAYVWFVLGFLAVGIPAILEVRRMFKKNIIETIIEKKEENLE